jgi:hypothetical protein
VGGFIHTDIPHRPFLHSPEPGRRTYGSQLAALKEPISIFSPAGMSLAIVS